MVSRLLPWLRLAWPWPSPPLRFSSRASLSSLAAHANEKEEQQQQQVHAEGKTLSEIRQKKAAELASLKSEIELMDAEISRLRELRRLPSAALVELPKDVKPSPRNNAQAAMDSVEEIKEVVGEEEEEEEEDEDEDFSQASKTLGLEHASSSPDQATIPVHPWSEWVAFLEELEKRGYAKTDNEAVEGDPGRPLVERAGLIRRMTNNFSRDRDDIVRFLSRKHIKVIANYGCPSTDSKVVNAGKRLRKDCALSEGDVCLQCNLKRSCTKAYAEILPHRAAETVDVVRFLVGFTWTMSSDTKGAGMFPKEVGNSIGALLKELLECMQKPRDPNLPRLSMETTRPQISDNSGDSLGPKGRFNKSKERSRGRIDSEDDDSGSFRRRDSSDLARSGRYGKGDLGRKREMKPRFQSNYKDGYMGNRNRVSFESSNSYPPMREKEQRKGKVRKADDESEEELDLSEDDDEFDDSFKPKNNSHGGSTRRRYKIIDTSGLQDDEDGLH